jgi:hypothetical protein
MLSTTTVAQRCQEAARGHDRPFVVEWDATDLATFEAKAARDTVFVRYHGCDIEVVDGCADAVSPGRFGSYGTPQFTSGATQGFDVKNEGELYAKLPLGASQLSGKIAAGESLHLKYFVTGVAIDSRAAVYEAELAGVRACAGATHWVSAYNVGAFELSSTEQSSREGSAAVAGDSRSHAQATVASAGDFTSCSTQDQRACRVPIRLALRPILPGSDPAGAPVRAPEASSDRGLVSAGGGSPAEQAKALWEDAERKHDAGDGKACLDEANRALAFDVHLGDSADFKELRARCEMAAGQCDQGTADLRATLAAADTRREEPDSRLDMMAREASNEECSSGTAKNDADFIQRAARELEAAASVVTPDGPRCKALIDGITAHLKTIKTGDASFNDHAYARGTSVYERAAACVAASSGRCSDGVAVVQSQCVLVSGTGCRDSAAASWKTTMQYAKPPIACH